MFPTSKQQSGVLTALAICMSLVASTGCSTRVGHATASSEVSEAGGLFGMFLFALMVLGTLGTLLWILYKVIWRIFDTAESTRVRKRFLRLQRDLAERYPGAGVERVRFNRHAPYSSFVALRNKMEAEGFQFSGFEAIEARPDCDADRLKEQVDAAEFERLKSKLAAVYPNAEIDDLAFNPHQPEASLGELDRQLKAAGTPIDLSSIDFADGDVWKPFAAVNRKVDNALVASVWMNRAASESSEAVESLGLPVAGLDDRSDSGISGTADGPTFVPSEEAANSQPSTAESTSPLADQEPARDQIERDDKHSVTPDASVKATSESKTLSTAGEQPETSSEDSHQATPTAASGPAAVADKPSPRAEIEPTSTDAESTESPNEDEILASGEGEEPTGLQSLAAFNAQARRGNPDTRTDRHDEFLRNVKPVAASKSSTATAYSNRGFRQPMSDDSRSFAGDLPNEKNAHSFAGDTEIEADSKRTVVNSLALSDFNASILPDPASLASANFVAPVSHSRSDEQVDSETSTVQTEATSTLDADVANDSDETRGEVPSAGVQRDGASDGEAAGRLSFITTSDDPSEANNARNTNGTSTSDVHEQRASVADQSNQQPLAGDKPTARPTRETSPSKGQSSSKSKSLSVTARLFGDMSDEMIAQQVASGNPVGARSAKAAAAKASQKTKATAKPAASKKKAVKKTESLFGSRTRPAKKRRTKTASAATPQRSENYPDDLTKIRGIGPVYETQLYANGIYTWWQIAETPVAQLKEIASTIAAANVDQWPSQARQLAKVHNRKGIFYSGPEPNRLTEIQGITDRVERAMFKAGIVSYQQLGKASVDKIQQVTSGVKLIDTRQIKRWIQKAQKLS